jgi:hypothetical protein
LEPLGKGLELRGLFGLELAQLFEHGLLGRSVAPLFRFTESLLELFLPELEGLGRATELLQGGLAQPGGALVNADGFGVAQGLTESGQDLLFVGRGWGGRRSRRWAHLRQGTRQVEG